MKLTFNWFCLYYRRGDMMTDGFKTFKKLRNVRLQDIQQKKDFSEYSKVMYGLSATACSHYITAFDDEVIDLSYGTYMKWSNLVCSRHYLMLITNKRFSNKFIETNIDYRKKFKRYLFEFLDLIELEEVEMDSFFDFFESMEQDEAAIEKELERFSDTFFEHLNIDKNNKNKNIFLRTSKFSNDFILEQFQKEIFPLLDNGEIDC